MDDTPRHAYSDLDAPAPTEAQLAAVLADSEAEAGVFVDGDALVRDLYADADRLEAEIAAERGRKGVRRR